MYNRLHGTTHVSLRYGNVYGPRQDPHGEAGVVAIFLGALADGKQARIFGEGAQTRDYVYVGDVARATVSSLGQEGGVFNIGTGREVSVVELYELCRQVAGSSIDAVRDARALGELQRSALDPSRAATELGFTPMVGLEDGLQATWEWINARTQTGSSGARDARIESRVDHPLAAPEELIRPWRLAAYIAGAVAVAELLLLLVIGGGALVEAVSHRVSSRRASAHSPRLRRSRKGPLREQAGHRPPRRRRRGVEPSSWC